MYGSGIWVGDGLYQWTLADTTLAVSGFLLEQNKCYTIIFQGSVFNSYDPLNEGDFLAKEGCTELGVLVKIVEQTPGDYYLKFVVVTLQILYSSEV